MSYYEMYRALGMKPRQAWRAAARAVRTNGRSAAAAAAAYGADVFLAGWNACRAVTPTRS